MAHEFRWFGRHTIGEGPLLAGFKFAIQNGRRPVYRRRRLEYVDGLLSGPAVAGLLAVLAARRNALRAWLSESAFRSLVVGALALGVGVQASSTPNGGTGPTKGHDNPSHYSTIGPAAGGDGGVARYLTLSESAVSKPGDSGGGHGANLASSVETIAINDERGQGWRVPASGAGAAAALGERTNPLMGMGLYNLPAGGDPYSSSGASGHDDPKAESSKPDAALANSDAAAFAPDPSPSPSERILPAADGVSEWRAAFSPTVLAVRARRGLMDVAGRSGTRVALRSPLTFANLIRRGTGAESTPLGASSLNRALPPRLDVPRPSGVPEPATWAMMLMGVALIGAAARSQRGRAFGRP